MSILDGSQELLNKEELVPLAEEKGMYLKGEDEHCTGPKAAKAYFWNQRGVFGWDLRTR